MGESGSRSLLFTIVGSLMLLVGLSVFGIRFQHAGPYAFPAGGNLRAGVLALLIGFWLLRPWLGDRPFDAALRWAALAVSPLVLFFALYSTFAEFEEVVVLKPTNLAGEPADLRLWIVDRADGTWVTMGRGKADEHSLGSLAPVDLLRDGELQCVIPERHEDRATVNEIHALRQEKYAVQRLATAVGLFGRTAGENTIALRLDACPKP